MSLGVRNDSVRGRQSALIVAAVSAYFAGCVHNAIVTATQTSPGFQGEHQAVAAEIDRAMLALGLERGDPAEIRVVNEASAAFADFRGNLLLGIFVDVARGGWQRIQVHSNRDGTLIVVVIDFPPESRPVTEELAESAAAAIRRQCPACEVRIERHWTLLM